MWVQYPGAPNSPRNWMKKMIRIGLWNQDHSYPRLPFSKIPVLKYLLGCFRGKSVSRVCWDMKLKSQDYSLKVSTQTNKQTNRMKLFLVIPWKKYFSDFKWVFGPNVLWQSSVATFTIQSIQLPSLCGKKKSCKNALFIQTYHRPPLEKSLAMYYSLSNQPTLIRFLRYH